MEFIINSPESPIFCHLFNFPIRYYGVFMSLSFLLGIISIYFALKNKYGKNESEKFLDYSFYVILISIICARAFYVIGSIDYYINFPKEILMINHGGLSIYGAILGGLLSMYIFSKKFEFDFLAHCDILAVVFPLCQSLGRLGNYFNQEAFGMPSNTFFKLYISEIYRPDNFQNFSYFHPTFLYESILDFCLFVILFKLLTRMKSGRIFLLYLISYSLIRLFVEFYRIDASVYLFGLSFPQVVSIGIIVLSLLVWLVYQRR